MEMCRLWKREVGRGRLYPQREKKGGVRRDQTGRDENVPFPGTVLYGLNNTRTRTRTSQPRAISIINIFPRFPFTLFVFSSSSLPPLSLSPSFSFLPLPFLSPFLPLHSTLLFLPYAQLHPMPLIVLVVHSGVPGGLDPYL